jgi:Tetrahydromethanopterin S-methyltransferase, subunit A
VVTTSPQVAVCSLTSRELVAPLSRLPGVALVGTLFTANLGIEQLIRTLAQCPSVRALLVCGRDSVRFRAGQSLVALFRHGISPDGTIRGAAGYLPMLRSITSDEIDRMRSRIEVVDACGIRDVSALRGLVDTLTARPPAGPPHQPGPVPAAAAPAFRRLRPGGRRRRLQDALDGFVVITVDHAGHRIMLRHYGSDLVPRHEMSGARAESMLLGLLRAGVINDLSHAGYLGGELAKAETALRLDLRYEQDLPLRRPGAAAGGWLPGAVAVPDQTAGPTADLR